MRHFNYRSGQLTAFVSMKNYISGHLSTASLLLATLLWGSSFPAAKIALRDYDPMVVIFGRMVIASLCFAFFVRRLSKGVVFRKSDLKYILFMSLCEPCLYLLLEIRALENTTASQAGMITSMFPLLVAVGAGLFLKERISRQMILGLGIAFLGACWLSLAGESTPDAPNPLLGNLLEFAAMIFGAGYALTLKRLACHYPPFLLAGLQTFIGSVFFLFFLFPESTTLPSGLKFGSALAVVYLGAAVSLGAYGLFSYGVSKIPASKASAFVNLIPVYAVVLGWMLLGEKFTGNQYAASLLVFAGVYISQEKSARQV